MQYEHVARYYERNKERIEKQIKRKIYSDEAEDVMQEVFLRMIAHYKNFDKEKGKFSAWVNGIVRNCIRDWQRGQQSRGFMVSESSVVNKEAIEPRYEDNSLEAERKIRHVVSKIRAKSQPARDIIYLNVVMGHTPKEIVEKTGLGFKNVNMHLYRFKKEMKDGDNKI